jgi:hypothetical protein
LNVVLTVALIGIENDGVSVFITRMFPSGLNPFLEYCIDVTKIEFGKWWQMLKNAPEFLCRVEGSWYNLAIVRHPVVSRLRLVDDGWFVGPCPLVIQQVWTSLGE